MQKELSLDDYLTISNHVSALHCDSKGWITIANKHKNSAADDSDENGTFWNQRHYHADDIIRHPQLIKEIKSFDCYVSQNSFYTTYRRSDTVKELRALYVDIDCYKAGISKDAVLYRIDEMCSSPGSEIPRPSLIIDSGRGIYCIWHINNVPYMALPLWIAVQKYLFDKFRDMGADRKSLDAQRVLRLVGTYNSKSNTQVTVIDSYPAKYDLRDIQKDYMPELKKERTHTQTRQNQKSGSLISIYNIHTLNYARISDLLTLLKIRNYDIHLYKTREITLFLYRYWTCCFTKDTQKALEEVLKLNNQFTYPLSTNEVLSATRSAENYYKKDQSFNAPNDYLIEILKITDEEERQLKTIISKREKYRRNNERRTPRNKNGLTPRQQMTKDIGERIRKLKLEGKTVTEIAEIVKIKRTMLYSTYSDYLKIDGLMGSQTQKSLKSKKYDTEGDFQKQGRSPHNTKSKKYDTLDKELFYDVMKRLLE